MHDQGICQESVRPVLSQHRLVLTLPANGAQPSTFWLKWTDRRPGTCGLRRKTSLFVALRRPVAPWRVLRRDACGPFSETTLQELRVAGRLDERTTGELSAMSLQRAPADTRLAGESVPLDPGTPAKRPEEHGPVQQLLGAACERHFLPPVATEGVGRKPQAGCQLGDRRRGADGRAMAGEVADALEGLRNRPVRRTRRKHPSTQQPERIVMPGRDLRDRLDQAVIHLLGPFCRKLSTAPEP